MWPSCCCSVLLYGLMCWLGNNAHHPHHPPSANPHPHPPSTPWGISLRVLLALLCQLTISMRLLMHYKLIEHKGAGGVSHRRGLALVVYPSAECSCHFKSKVNFREAFEESGSVRSWTKVTVPLTHHTQKQIFGDMLSRLYEGANMNNGSAGMVVQIHILLAYLWQRTKQILLAPFVVLYSTWKSGD